jgi:IS30 family transposase
VVGTTTGPVMPGKPPGRGHSALARIVAQKLTKSWAPQQIAGWLKRTFPHDETYQVSPETIY